MRRDKRGLSARPTCAGDAPSVDFPVYPTRANAGAFLEAVLTMVGW